MLEYVTFNVPTTAQVVHEALLVFDLRSGNRSNVTVTFSFEELFDSARALSAPSVLHPSLASHGRLHLHGTMQSSPSNPCTFVSLLLRPETSITETVSHLYGVKMTATVLLTIQSIHPMKRGGSPTHVACSHATMHVTDTMTGTGITITQVMTVLTGPPQGLQDILLMTYPWIGCAQSIGSLMNPTLVVLIPVIVMPHLLEMTALAVFYEGTIILFMIPMTKALGIMVIHLVVVLGQQNAPDTPNPLAGAPTPSFCRILTPRIRVQVDH